MYNAVILECQQFGDNMESITITKAQGNVQVGVQCYDTGRLAGLIGLDAGPT